MNARVIFPILGALGLAFGGCVSEPAPAYLQVDAKSPEFQAKVAAEAKSEEATGKSASDARASALQRVTDQFVEAEKAKRLAEVAPLVDALSRQSTSGPPSGGIAGPGSAPTADAWAYTRTWTIQCDGKTTICVERFDPTMPPDRLWNLISIDGRAPAAADLADYHRGPRNRSQNGLMNDSLTDPDIEELALNANFTLSPPGSDGSETFSFTTEAINVALIAHIPRRREIYRIDPSTQALLGHQLTFLEPMSLLLGAGKLDTFDVSTDYASAPAGRATLPKNFHARMQGRALAKSTGEIVLDIAYSDYRPVPRLDNTVVAAVDIPALGDLLAGQGLKETPFPIR